MNDDSFPYQARSALNLTTTEAGQLVHVTRRTWEMWESGKSKMPTAKRELLVSKFSGDISSPQRELVVVLAHDGTTPIDVVASDRFCSLEKKDDGDTYVISSLAISREHGRPRPYVHRQSFQREHNQHVIEKVRGWKSVVMNE